MLVVLALSASLLTACGGSSSGSDDKRPTTVNADVKVGDWGATIRPGGKPVKGGTLRIDQLRRAPGISPLQQIKQPDSTGENAVLAMFDQLVEFRPGQLDPQPGLAESWEISSDGKLYTFKLRDAQFSNGMPVTAADVKFSLSRNLAEDAFYRDAFAVMKSIQTPDDKTVIIKTAAPSPALIYYLAHPNASIMPAKVVKSMGVAGFNQKPVGSGPFKLERWVRDREIDLVRNESYWRAPLPYLDKVVFIATPDDNTRALDAQSGTVDIADSLPFSQIKRVQSSNKVDAFVAPSGTQAAILINNDRKPFGETAVRQALNYATPGDAIAKVVFVGAAPRMNTIVPKTKFWTDKAKAYPYDIAKAKKLLEGSSAPTGFAAEITVSGTDQASVQIAQILKQAWAKIGIKLTIKTTEDATRRDEWYKGKYDLMLPPIGTFTSDIPVDDGMAQLWFASPAIKNLFTGYRNKHIEDLTNEALVSLDDEKRRQLFEEIHVKSMEDPPAIPLVYPPNTAAVSKRVHGFSYMLLSTYPLDSVWVG